MYVRPVGCLPFSNDRHDFLSSWIRVEYIYQNPE